MHICITLSTQFYCIYSLVLWFNTFIRKIK
uniref:Uncharacterized protein n=1 Tax=Anguilla anguilla TaxID=7936 RepID=A0A0E9QII9_ANGAN